MHKPPKSACHLDSRAPMLMESALVRAQPVMEDRACRTPHGQDMHKAAHSSMQSSAPGPSANVTPHQCTRRRRRRALRAA